MMLVHGAMDPDNRNVIAFKLVDFKSKLSHQLAFQLSTKVNGNMLKYCNVKGYSKCILLMYPKGNDLFLCRDVTIVFVHHRVMRYNHHCKSGQ